MCSSSIKSYDKQTPKERGLPNENTVYLLTRFFSPYIPEVQIVHNRSPETNNY